MKEKEKWITKNQTNLEAENKVYERQTPVPVNLKNCLQNLKEPSITDQQNDAAPRTSQQNIPIENTKSKSRFEEKNTNSIRQQEKRNQRRPDNCITKN